MGTVCYGVVKYLVVLVNFLFWLFGIAIVGLALWMIIDPTFYVSMAQDSEHYYISTYILLAAGVLLVIVAFLGCCGAFKESQCMLISFFSILIIILVAQIACIVWAYINKDSLEPMVRKTVKSTVQDEYMAVESRRTAFNTIQKGLQCCGAEQPSDWMRSHKVVMEITSEPRTYEIPESCCRAGVPLARCQGATKKVRVGDRIDPDIVYTDGCIDKVVQVLHNNFGIIIIVCISVILIEVIGLLFALVLMVAISRTGRYKA